MNKNTNRPIVAFGLANPFMTGRTRLSEIVRPGGMANHVTRKNDINGLISASFSLLDDAFADNAVEIMKCSGIS